MGVMAIDRLLRQRRPSRAARAMATDVLLCWSSVRRSRVAEGGAWGCRATVPS
jgi:hypothetical protein